ncbi:hypothetical protein ASD15_13010 [Massilia sp. Root351]|uniref:hypothetical protein n=1 Tax=Massilia sp. Root351 TaxID=1736522 RepID=UPI00070A54F9|nr:hypothetical protein [Massilia sp. Root351]KQV80824.1 hypothetical protein ASD15_13010 [Massilia sp. Root351]
MAISSYARWMLAQEARSLLTRLRRVRPFVLIEPMVPAAALLPSAQTAIETHLAQGRRGLHGMVMAFLAWLQGPAARNATAAEAQRRFTFVRLKFNAALTQFDLFNDVITQRSEHKNGTWLSGLDVVSADALALPGSYYRAPPVICYLDRGPGAAIRRARTRLPGGGDNPVAIVRVPRERMVGSSIASSLFHEVGHQGAALLDLVNSLRPVLQSMQRGAGGDGGASPAHVWRLWERWISEVVADLWSLARVGVAATMGLIGVVSLPRVFVFRVNPDDPHPAPWIRVKLSCALGEELFPHPQWRRVAALWESFYPLSGLPPEQRRLLLQLEDSLPALAGLLARHRPALLRGRTLPDVMAVRARHPRRLASLFRQWSGAPQQMYDAAPSLAFAVLGQARADGRLSPEHESVLLGRLLTHWALRSTLDLSALCGGAAQYPQYTQSRRTEYRSTIL